MIEVINLTEEKDILQAVGSLHLVKPTNFKVLYGFFEEGKCVGCVWLSSEYPYEMSLEYNSNSIYAAKAFTQVFSGLFTIVPRITSIIRETNFRALQMAKRFGFKQLYTVDGFVRVELSPESYKYKKKYPLGVVQ